MFHIVHPKRGERLFSGLFCISVSIGVTWLLWARPLSCAWFPSCPLHSIGIICPGCGSLRALDSLLAGHIRQALAFNILFVIFSPWLLFWLINHGMCAVAGKRIALVKQPSFLGWTILWMLLSYFLLRNMPFESFAWLKPHIVF